LTLLAKCLSIRASDYVHKDRQRMKKMAIIEALSFNIYFAFTSQKESEVLATWKYGLPRNSSRSFQS
jgi:hypothetical protein